MSFANVCKTMAKQTFLAIYIRIQGAAIVLTPPQLQLVQSILFIRGHFIFRPTANKKSADKYVFAVFWQSEKKRYLEKKTASKQIREKNRI